MLPSEVSSALTVSSKAHPMYSLRYDEVKRQARETMSLLGVDKLDVFYLHGVDQATSIEETLCAVNDLHREGVFDRFGLSNYPAWQVVQVYYLCERLGYIVPTVFVTTCLCLFFALLCPLSCVATDAPCTPIAAIKDCTIHYVEQLSTRYCQRLGHSEWRSTPIAH